MRINKQLHCCHPERQRRISFFNKIEILHYAQNDIRLPVLIMILFALTSLAMLYAEGTSDDASVYYNAGTEKYLQGRFSEAVENLEKAQSLDDKNLKIKELIVKILLEAATQNHLSRNYKQAFEYMKKAKAIAPDNPQVQEMYALTYGILSPSKEKLIPKEKSPLQPIVEEAEKSNTSTKPEKATQPSPHKNEAPKDNTIASQPVRHEVLPEKKKIEKYSIHIAIFAAVSMFAAFILFVLFKLKSSALRGARLKLSELEENLVRINNDSNQMAIELEKTKERCKYEHQSAEQYRKELKEKERKDEDHVKMDLELRTKQIEEKLRAESSERHKRKDSHQEAFLHQQQAKFLEYMGDTSGTEDIQSPVIDSARERIAAMAENLYEYAPGAAHDFLGKMAANTNPMIRANVVQALARIARHETIEILFTLYNDTDARVKREVLKYFKQLLQKTTANAIILPAGLEDKIRAVLDEEKQKGDWIL